jgi:predicted component of type VI protein secretion system
VPSLIAENGPMAGQRLEVDGELVIGRLGGDVVIDDVKLSRRHAVFRTVDGALEVEDLGSTNGTFVESRRIEGPTPLRNGARVTLGGTVFVAEIAPVMVATQVAEAPGDPTRLAGGPASPGRTARRPAAGLREALPAPGAAAPEPAPTPAEVGAFAPPAVRHGGLATRSWVPVALSFGSVLVVALALVVYFAAR